MQYVFPADITLEEVREAIAKANARLEVNAFIEADRGDYVIFNYVISFPEVFPVPITGDDAIDREYAILRECRGLTFYKDGRIAARKLNKFFNVGERPETMPSIINWSLPHSIFNKEDGSMITPFWNGDELQWHTKMGDTDVAKLVWPVLDRWIKSGHPQDYIGFAEYCRILGLTPMFEFCSRSQRIVVDHPVDRMPLLAVRDNSTGLYINYETLLAYGNTFNIEVVGQHSSSNVGDIEAFLSQTAGEIGIEGYIIAFEDGHRLKVKTDEYRTIHRVVSDLASEKSVVRLIVEDKIDDALPMLAPEDVAMVTEFARLFAEGISLTAATVQQLAATGKDNAEDQRGFAEWVQKHVPERLRPLVFRAGTGADVQEATRALISKHLGSGPRLETVRDLWGGHRWTWGNQMGQRVADE